MYRCISVFCLLLTLFFSSCSWQSPQKPAKPLVIASISPYDTFIREIAGDTLEVMVAVPPNYNSHIFEPTPKQMQGFQHAVIWFGIGEPFEKKLVQALTSHNEHLLQVDLGQDLPLEKYHTESLATNVCGEAHDHEARDLHFWMSPKLALMQAETIAHFLINRFPEHTALYEKNLTTLEQKFQTLDLTLSSLLGPLKERAIIVSHPSLGYFCQDYHLIQLSIECEGKTPMPKDVSQVLTLAKMHPALCVFTQEQFDNRGAISIAQRLKLPVYTINPNDPNYFTNLHHIAQEIAQSSP